MKTKLTKLPFYETDNFRKFVRELRAAAPALTHRWYFHRYIKMCVTEVSVRRGSTVKTNCRYFKTPIPLTYEICDKLSAVR